MRQINIDRRSGTSIQQQLYEQLRSAMLDGSTQAGDRLPSTRSLAAQLNIARGTVDLVYARLTDEGFTTARGQGGTYVSPVIERSPTAIRKSRGADLSDIPPLEDYSLPFRFGVPALDLFPRKLWSRLAAREARKVDPAGLPYPDPTGLVALRQAISGYVAVARGVVCEPEQVVVTTGYQGALNLVAHLVLEPGDPVWVEDPGYGFALQALRSLSMHIIPVPVDQEGLQVAAGRAACPGAKLAVATPAHQFPLGWTMSLPRRQALLSWAAENGSWILEDDYDCEFHYVGNRPPALKSIDRSDRVFYAGSFSKTLFPALRLGYVIVPSSLVRAARDGCQAVHRGASILEQAVVAAFLSEGHFARHLRRMRIQYHARSRALVQALEFEFGTDVEISPPAGGLHLLARFARYGPDAELARRAKEHGLMPHSLSEQSIVHDVGEGLLLSFANLPEREAPAAAATLRAAIAGFRS